MLQLIIPDLGTADLTPALHALLARSRRLDRPVAGGLTEALCQTLGLAPPYPIAALCHAYDSGQADNTGYWLRADPVYLHLNIDKLILGDPRRLALSMAEALQLTASLNAHFQPDGLRFQALAADRWYLRLAQPLAMSTTVLEAAIGHSIETTLPQGEEAALWRRYLNEAQMVLHDHPVNQAREARGVMPVNSIWFWGEGVAPEAPRPEISALFADAPIAAALAQGMGIRHEQTPHGLIELERGVSIASDRIVVVLGALRPPTDSDDASASKTLPQHYENQWFAPLLKALQRGRMARLVLTGIGTPAFDAVITRGDAWKLWLR